jgi:tRNA 2-thiouridine synthesizing protein A
MNESAASDETLARDVEAIRDASCVRCGHRLCGHLAVINIVLGLKDAPHCLACLAATMEQPSEALRDQAWSHISQRDCFRRAWQDSSVRESFGHDDLPRCLWPQGAAASSEIAASPPRSTSKEVPDDTWNAGDLGCGDLVLALRGKLRALPPRGVLRVIALDPAAPEDIPAWCRLTGNALLRSAHPEYDIRRKGE